jgi:hypothetical protein
MTDALTPKQIATASATRNAANDAYDTAVATLTAYQTARDHPMLIHAIEPLLTHYHAARAAYYAACDAALAADSEYTPAQYLEKHAMR